MILAAAVLPLLLPPPWLGAKEKKVPRSVTGAVLDAGDNGIVGASVELTDVQTGKTMAKFTGEGGRYEFSGLKPTHDYKVQATHKGVSSEVRTASSLDTRNKIVLNLRIPPPES